MSVIVEAPMPMLLQRESESTAMLRITDTAIDRRVVSPTIVQEMKARGVAQVLVHLRPAISTAAAGEELLPDDLRRCFIDSEMSSSYALRHAAAPRRTRSAAALSDSETPGDVQVYENLGIVLGTVDLNGLASLQQNDGVAAVMGCPQFSLIQPQEVSRPSQVELWGAEAIRTTRLRMEGLDGTGVLVGHLDTGVDGSHPALEDALDSFIDTDALGDVRAASAFDSGRHGTHTAGIIAGRARNIGIAPGCKLASAVVIEDPDVVRRILGGLNWVVGKGVRIINMSFGIRGYHEDFLLLMDVIRSKDILPIAAVGNEGPGTSRSPGNYPTVLSVGAMDVNGKIWDRSSSQRFARANDPLVPGLVAPGVAVLSAVPKRGYAAMNGTSMAAPHVAGLAALLFQAQPTATAAQIEQAILSSCTLQRGMERDRANRGCPDAVKALQALTGIRLGAPARGRSVPAAKSPARKVQAKRRRKPGKRTVGRGKTTKGGRRGK